MSKETKAPFNTSSPNALAKSALGEILKIKEQAKKDMQAQVEKIKEAKKAIQKRVKDLQHQEVQLDEVLAEITGKDVASPKTKTDLNDVRERMINWMKSHSGEKYSAQKLKKEFPELGSRSVSIVLAKAIEEGTIKTAGVKANMTYSA
jgi:exonuclease VII small subunit